MPQDDKVWEVDDLSEPEEDTAVELPRDDTGKYQTLPGYAVTQEIRDGERGIGREEVFVAYKVMKLAEGLAPFIADALTDEFRRWFKMNYGLIRVTMGYKEITGRPPNE